MRSAEYWRTAHQRLRNPLLRGSHPAADTYSHRSEEYRPITEEILQGMFEGCSNPKRRLEIESSWRDRFNLPKLTISFIENDEMELRKAA